MICLWLFQFYHWSSMYVWKEKLTHKLTQPFIPSCYNVKSFINQWVKHQRKHHTNINLQHKSNFKYIDPNTLKAEFYETFGQVRLRPLVLNIKEVIQELLLTHRYGFQTWSLRLFILFNIFCIYLYFLWPPNLQFSVRKLSH